MSKGSRALSARAAGITPSLTLAITAKAKKMKQDGISVIGFGAGEPDFGTPEYIIRAAKAALDKNFTKYTESSGMPQLRAAIAEKLRRENGVSYQPAQIIVSNGGKHALLNAVLAVCEAGDEVLIPSPYWLTYPELVRTADAKSVFVPTKAENGFKLTAAELERAVTPATKAVILNSPNNPTGAVYTRQELEALARVIVEKDLIVISDEIYEKMVYGGAEHISIASLGEEIKERTILVNGLSKCYSMTGWRVGYVAAPLHIAKAIDGLQSHGTSNINSIAQAAALEALTSAEGESFLSDMLRTFDGRRQYIEARIDAIPGLGCIKPQGAFYVFADISALLGKSYGGKVLNDSLDAAEAMLDAGVAVVPGSAFGSPDYIRLSYAIDKADIEEGLNRIEDFVSKYV